MPVLQSYLDEHQRLGKAWLDAEQQRVAILQKLLKDCGDKCAMDYPPERWEAYLDAIQKAKVAGKAYQQWLTREGIPAN